MEVVVCQVLDRCVNARPPSDIAGEFSALLGSDAQLMKDYAAAKGEANAGLTSKKAKKGSVKKESNVAGVVGVSLGRY